MTAFIVLFSSLFSSVQMQPPGGEGAEPETNTRPPPLYLLLLLPNRKPLTTPSRQSYNTATRNAQETYTYPLSPTAAKHPLRTDTPAAAALVAPPPLMWVWQGCCRKP